MSGWHDTRGLGVEADTLLTVNGLAEHLAVSRETVYRLVRRGDIRPVRVGERLRFLPRDVDAYLEARRVATG